MAMKRVAVEIGMGTDIRGADYTKAAVRALRDALWHNSLNVAAALGKPTDSMVVDVLIGVPKPDRVDKAEVLAVLPHGTGTVDGGRGRARDLQRCRHGLHGDRECRGDRAARRCIEAAMPLKRVILEMGTGNDLHGGDYTKAALRAVQDALHHSSLSMIRSLGLDSKAMQVEVTIGVQKPERSTPRP